MEIFSTLLPRNLLFLLHQYSLYLHINLHLLHVARLLDPSGRG